MAPHETGRRVLSEDAHRLGQILAAFLGIELLLFFVEDLIELRIGVADARRFAAVKYWCNAALGSCTEPRPI